MVKFIINVKDFKTGAGAVNNYFLKVSDAGVKVGGNVLATTPTAFNIQRVVLTVKPAPPDKLTVSADATKANHKGTIHVTVKDAAGADLDGVYVGTSAVGADFLIDGMTLPAAARSKNGVVDFVVTGANVHTTAQTLTISPLFSSNSQSVSIVINKS